MMIDDMTSGVRHRVHSACLLYNEIWHACRDTRQQAASIMARNSRSVANVEIGAAKNIYTSARAAFERARRDGARRVVRRPSRYIPSARKQTISAYRITLSLLDKTRGELTFVVRQGYRRVAQRAAASIGAHTDPIVATTKRRQSQASSSAGSMNKRAASATTKRQRSKNSDTQHR